MDYKSWLRSIRNSARILLICLVGFLLTLLVLRVLAFSVDKEVALTVFNAGSDNAVAYLAWIIASVGEDIWIPLVLWLYIFRNNRYGWTSAVLFAVATIMSMMLVESLKSLFALPRPPEVSGLAIQYRFGSPTNAAFPSGHTSRAFTVATVIWNRYPRWRFPFLALAAGTGISMLVVGYHFPSDVLGGMFTGIAIGTFAVNIARARSDREVVTG